MGALKKIGYTDMDWDNTALLLIDMQEDFARQDGAAYIDGTAAVIGKITTLVKQFRKRGLPIIHIVRLYHQDGSNAELCRKELIMQGRQIVAPTSKGAQVVKELLPEKVAPYTDQALLDGHIIQLAANEFIVYKPRWGAFFSTPLHKWLIDRNISSVLIAGCNFPNCPRTTIYQASERDYRIGIVPEAISRIYPTGIQELQGIGVNIYHLEELKKELQEKKIDTQDNPLRSRR